MAAAAAAWPRQGARRGARRGAQRGRALALALALLALALAALAPGAGAQRSGQRSRQRFGGSGGGRRPTPKDDKPDHYKVRQRSRAAAAIGVQLLPLVGGRSSKLRSAVARVAQHSLVVRVGKSPPPELP